MHRIFLLVFALICVLSLSAYGGDAANNETFDSNPNISDTLSYDTDGVEEIVSSVAVDVGEFIDYMYDNIENLPQNSYTLNITGLPTSVSFEMKGEAKPLSITAYGRTVELNESVYFYGNNDYDLFAYGDIIILTWDYYDVGYTYVIGKGFDAYMEPGVNDSAILTLRENGDLGYVRVNNRGGDIIQMGGLSVATGYDTFFSSAGLAKIENGEIVLEEPDEYFTVSDKYDLDAEFANQYSEFYSSIEEVFEDNKKHYN